MLADFQICVSVSLMFLMNKEYLYFHKNKSMRINDVLNRPPWKYIILYTTFNTLIAIYGPNGK